MENSRAGRFLLGMHRWPKEHFSVYVASAARGKVAAVAPRPLRYYADPFLWTREGRTCLFVEEFDYRLHRGRLCCMELDEHLGASAPTAIALDCRHVSFPFLFEHDGELYMVPETCADRCIDLYRCDAFPHGWTRVRRLLQDIDAADTSLLRHEHLWWLFTSVRETTDDGRHLEIFHTADPLSGNWVPHPVNAQRLYADSELTCGRNAGPPFAWRGRLLRPVQKDSRYYGEGMLWMQVDALNAREFAESPFDGSHPMAQLVRSTSPHHICREGDLVTWDVRDRVNRWEGLRLVPEAAASPGLAALGLPQDIASELRCSG